MDDSKIREELEIKTNNKQTSKVTSIDPNCAPEAAHHYAFQQPSHACDDPAKNDNEIYNSNASSFATFPVKL